MLPDPLPEVDEEEACEVPEAEDERVLEEEALAELVVLTEVVALV